MILASIKESTKGFHQEIESLAYSDKILDNSLNIEEYKKLLIVNYIFNKNLENKLLRSHDNNLLEKIDFKSRLKSELIEKDLENVGVKPEDVFKEMDFNDIDNSYNSLGYLYLSEGSTLGGNIISKRLKENPNFRHIDKFNFYGCYGDSISQKWKNFCEVMKEDVSEDKESEVINSANKAYSKYIDIFKSVV